jgi:hypothetical protein
MSKVKMTAEEKAAWLEKTTGSSIVAKVGINDRGNAIVVQDAQDVSVGPTRHGSVRVIEMTAGTDLSSVKSRNVVASKVISRYAVRYSQEGVAEQRRLQAKGIQFAQGVMRGEKKMSRGLGI